MFDDTAMISYCIGFKSLFVDRSLNKQQGLIRRGAPPRRPKGLVKAPLRAAPGRRAGAWASRARRLGRKEKVFGGDAWSTAWDNTAKVNIQGNPNPEERRWQSCKRSWHGQRGQPTSLHGAQLPGTRLRASSLRSCPRGR